MSGTTTTTSSETTGHLRQGRLGVFDIIFFVMSAAAPLTVFVSAAPLAFKLGGIGAPGGMVFAGMILILFAVGFTAMSAHVRNAGAFYAYASAGLGKAVGVGVAFVTLFAYTVLMLAFAALIGFFGSLTLDELVGVSAPWWLMSLIAVGLVAFLGRRQVDVGAKTLGILLTAEVTLLLVLSIAVLVRGGAGEAPSLESFYPSNVLGAGGVAVLMVIGFGAYVGFEGTAIYAEEAKDPATTIPKATYGAIAILAGLYAFTFWIYTYAFGVEGLLTFVAGDDYEGLAFATSSQFLGEWSSKVMSVLVVTSFLACLIAFHNAATRYVFALGRETLLPGALARTNASGAPATASLTMSIVTLVAMVTAAAAQLDPYLQFTLWTYSPGVAAIVFAQAATAIAVLAFFAKDRRGFSVWRVAVAPGLGALGLVVGFFLIVNNFPVVSGLEGAVNWVLLSTIPIFFLGGLAYALVIKSNDPARYEALASRSEEELTTP